MQLVCHVCSRLEQSSPLEVLPIPALVYVAHDGSPAQPSSPQDAHSVARKPAPTPAQQQPHSKSVMPPQLVCLYTLPSKPLSGVKSTYCDEPLLALNVRSQRSQYNACCCLLAALNLAKVGQWCASLPTSRNLSGGAHLCPVLPTLNLVSRQMGHASSSGNVCACATSGADALLVSARSGVDGSETFAADLPPRPAGQRGHAGDHPKAKPQHGSPQEHRRVPALPWTCRNPARGTPGGLERPSHESGGTERGALHLSKVSAAPRP